ncbi:MAG: hypothetical protein BA865_11055 [Desulfobacterales bacterium S5133MH4]|nr:MAG: hypothetical protein BA865_11055 [Desulfobacterales bacterium S5133MH4]
MKKLGIHVRLLLAAFTLISAATFALGHMGMNISREFVQTRFEQRISFLARYVALNAELGILIGARSMLGRLAANLLSEEDVVEVAILDSHGEELAGVSKEIYGSFSVVEMPVFLKESQEESKAFKWDVNAGQGGRLIGKVRITYSTTGIDQLLTTMRNRFISLSAGLSCLAGLIFYILSRSLVAPVTQLAQAARQVAQGDLDLRAHPGNLPETRELAVAFNAMLDSLARSRKDLKEANEEMMRQNTLAEMGKFSLMIAHEVKNPLSIIKSSLDVLKKDHALSSDNIMVSYMEDEIRRLNRLIEDFLLFARPAQPSFRYVDVNALVNKIVMRFELQKAGFPVEIRTHIPDQPCHTYVDPDLVTRAIGNILKNAFEANGDKGAVHVTVSCLDNLWVAQVEDEGEGIKSEDIDKIFEPFFTTRSKGTGLGLAYASQVIRSHGGTITAQNRMESGARFRVELPIKDERNHDDPCADS